MDAPPSNNKNQIDLQGARKAVEIASGQTFNSIQAREEPGEKSQPTQSQKTVETKITQ